MAVQNQKKKLLAVLQILLQRTDENHTLSAQDILSILASEYGIDAERKGIYADIEALKDMQIHIEQNKGSTPGYYVKDKVFELPELKLLVDAVQSSKFITSEKSEALIKKLESFASVYQARQLQRQVVLYGRPKAENETIFTLVDRIHAALFENVQISFQYKEWTPKKQLQLKKNGAYYKVSPWALTWEDENYYLLAYDAAADLLKHYRVDKMQNLSLLEEKRLGVEKYKSFNMPAFAKKTFAMYGGHDEEISLQCKNHLAGVIIDRFGKNCMMIPMEDCFKAKITVTVSEQFFGWLAGLGNAVEITWPQHVRQEYKEYLNDILKQYES